MLHTQKEEGNKANQRGKDVLRVLRHGARTLCRPGRICLILLLAYFSAPWKPLFGQATTGYTKLNAAPITVTTFTTGTLTDGVAYNFEVTALNSAGIESGPSNIVTGVVPAAGTHTATVSWTVGVNDVTYNVYSQQVAAANPPGAAQVTVN